MPRYWMNSTPLGSNRASLSRLAAAALAADQDVRGLQKRPADRAVMPQADGDGIGGTGPAADVQRHAVRQRLAVARVQLDDPGDAVRVPAPDVILERDRQLVHDLVRRQAIQGHALRESIGVYLVSEVPSVIGDKGAGELDVVPLAVGQFASKANAEQRLHHRLTCRLHHADRFCDPWIVRCCLLTCQTSHCLLHKDAD
jgi:hypothetical protein